MDIANPIYDVVFKYLIEDNNVAKIFLSSITGLEITNLEFIPQELVVDKTHSSHYQSTYQQKRKQLYLQWQQRIFFFSILERLEVEKKLQEIFKEN